MGSGCSLDHRQWFVRDGERRSFSLLQSAQVLLMSPPQPKRTFERRHQQPLG